MAALNRRTLIRWTALGAAALAACDRGPRVTMLAGPRAVAAQATDPALAVDPTSHDPLLVWVAGDGDTWHLYFARSRDAGDTWSAPVRVTDREHDIHPHGESSPRLVAGRDGAIGVAWTSSRPVPGRRWPASDVRFARSVDGGATWSRSVTLNDDTASGPRGGGHIFHGAAWDGGSTFLVAWLDERSANPRAGTVDSSGESDATVYLASSRDLGRTWSANRPLWEAVCPCCRVALAARGPGAVVAAWRHHFAGDVRDVVVAPVGGGASPVAPRRVHDDGWVYPGCPHTGPGLALDSVGGTHVAWYSGKPGAMGVFYARELPGRGFEPPVPLVAGRVVPSAHPRVTATADGGALIAVDVTPAARNALLLAYMAPDGGVARTVVRSTDGVDHPEVAALDSTTALAAWTTTAPDRRDMSVARVQLR